MDQTQEPNLVVSAVVALTPEQATAELKHAAMLLASGDAEGGRVVLQRIVPTLRGLTTEQPRRYAPLLAKVLGQLARCLHHLDSRSAAADAMLQATSVWHSLVSLTPGKYESNLLGDLRTQAFLFSRNREPRQALAARREIVTILGNMAAIDPKTHGAAWLAALREGAALGPEYVNRQARIVALNELLSASQKLMDQYPTQFTRERVRALNLAAEQVQATNMPLDRKALLREAQRLRLKMISTTLLRALTINRMGRSEREGRS